MGWLPIWQAQLDLRRIACKANVCCDFDNVPIVARQPVERGVIVHRRSMAIGDLLRDKELLANRGTLAHTRSFPDQGIRSHTWRSTDRSG